MAGITETGDGWNAASQRCAFHGKRPVPAVICKVNPGTGRRRNGNERLIAPRRPVAA
jgi:hypothetical protein